MCDLRPHAVSLCVAVKRTVVWFLCGYAPALVVLALVGAGGAASGLAADLRQPVAPPLSLPDLDGRTRTLNEFLGAKPVLLEFMSTDCPHCRHMAPVLTRLHAVYGNRVSFVTVAFDRRATRVRAFAQVHGHPWCYLLGDDNTVRAYALGGVPTFLLLGPDGRIRGVQVGSCAYDDLARAIKALIGPP
jgi:thiol-disulfide isomerase/thioredoxin